MTANIKEKNAEIRNPKTAADVLEKDIQDRNQKIESLKDQLEACQHEKERVEDISDILNGLNGHKKTEVLPKSEKNPANKSAATPTIPALKEKSISSECKVGLGVDGGKESKPVCLNMFMNGKCEDKSCSRQHSINLKKVRRGI